MYDPSRVARDRCTICQCPPFDRVTTGVQALLVRVAAGTLWIEHRFLPEPSVTVRIVKRPPGGAVRTVLLASGRTAATVKDLVRVRTVSGGLMLTRLDRRF